MQYEERNECKEDAALASLLASASQGSRASFLFSSFFRLSLLNSFSMVNNELQLFAHYRRVAQIVKKRASRQ